MKTRPPDRLPLLFLAALFGVLPAMSAAQTVPPPSGPNVAACLPSTAAPCVPLTINLVDSKTGNAIAPGSVPYRWLVQVDTTIKHTPGELALPGKALSVSLHKSYAPPIAAGDTSKAGGPALPKLDPALRYFVSVMPYQDSSYNMGGAPVAFSAGAASTTVSLSPLPVPTAQISVLVFEDKHPINNEDELPEERGLAGFNVQLYDTGGTMGISGGLVSNDAFGHKLGTVYGTDSSGNLDPSIVVQEGTGMILTDSTGTAIIKNIPPGRWSVKAVPPNMPAGQEWHQTSTLEGKNDIEAFVNANEPPVFVEFGPPGYHVFIGFIQKFNDLASEPAPSGRVTLTGRITNNHTSRPPDYSFYSGKPMLNAWVGLNNLSAGAAGEGLYAAPCDPLTGQFSIPNVPIGSNYQLVVWDENLDNVFAFADASVPGNGANANGGSYDMGDVPVFSWFSNLVVDYFYDLNGNGIRDPGEPPMVGQNVNIRFRDGSIYDSAVSNDAGRAEFHEIFPLFNWFVTEFDFSRFGTTGLTLRVDSGGPINASDPDSMGGMLNPQLQPSVTNTVTGNNKSRVETLSSIDGSLVATQAFQVFLGQTVHMEYGKHVYGDVANGGVVANIPNGGIAGGVWYDTTREADDPRIDVQEFWCPGIPRVQTVLYKEDPRATLDPALTPPRANPLYHGQIADLNANGRIDLSDVDNWPFGWASGGAMGPEDLKRNGPDQATIDACNLNRNCAFDFGDSMQVGSTTSWDDATPSGCVGPVFYANGIQDAAHATDCFDGLRNFNQARDGSSDGFYGFGGVNGPAAPQLAAGNYIVEAVAPPGYIHVHEESKNIQFGQPYVPSPQNLPAECVGDLHDVGTTLSLFPGVPVNPPYAGSKRHYCDRKLVPVSNGQDAAADFFLYTEVPVAASVVGVTTDDLTNEFDPNAPNFGEKYAPPHMPISIQDWTGKELMRTYTDQYGAYNALVPSSYSANIPVPSGYAPNMLKVCMNHPGPVLDTNPASPTFNQMVTDPYFLRQYSQFCYNWSFMPGKTSYLDTPVVPVAAFTGPQQYSLDCELPDRTPKIYSAMVSANNGPWIQNTSTDILTILSEGTAVPVMNPLFDTTNPPAAPRTVNRDYGFGTRCMTASQAGCTAVSSVTIGGTPATIVTWSPTSITVRANNPQGTIGDLVVTRGDSGKSSVSGVSVTVARSNSRAPRVVAPGQTIQSVIDSAATLAGDTILVPPGRYNELLIMTKPVRLQGAGPGSTTIDAAKTPASKINDWQNRMNAFMASHPTWVLPGQPTGAGLPEPTLFATEQGPGLIVAGPSGSFNSNSNPFVFRSLSGTNGNGLITGPNARVDGFTFTGGDMGGAIFINGYAHYFQVTNNRIVGNQGFYGGGIRSGYPGLVTTVNGGDGYVSSQNDNLVVRRNQIIENGGLAGAGGGVSMCSGSTGYQITQNWVCGNFSSGSGGGIGHMGFSNNASIDHNTIIFNQTFDQSTTPGGGGIFVGGEPPVATAVGGAAISPGTGNVTIDANVIQGNLAGAGDGGGIRAEFVNGADVVTAGALPLQILRLPAFLLGGYRLHVYNNAIADNMAGLAGGAISLQDVVLADIVHNTIVNNDSSATSGSAFPAGSPNQSSPLPGGVVSHAHTGALSSAFAPFSLSAANRVSYAVFANPAPFANNVIQGSRSLFAQIDQASTNVPAPFFLTPAPASFATDLAVMGTGPTSCNGGPCNLHPTYTLLTSLAAPYTPYASASDHNRTGSAGFASTYQNGARSALAPFGSTTDVQMAPAFDEGGNFIDVRFGPLTLYTPANALNFNFHMGAGVPGSIANGQTLNNLYSILLVPAPLRNDIDGQTRSANTVPDVGADRR